MDSLQKKKKSPIRENQKKVAIYKKYGFMFAVSDQHLLVINHVNLLTKEKQQRIFKKIQNNPVFVIYLFLSGTESVID